MNDAAGKRITSLTEAAKVLRELGICKAFRDGNKINGPNCYRFGHADSVPRKWYWEVMELLDIALERKSASPEVIQKVAERYGIQLNAPNEKSSADIEQNIKVSQQTGQYSRAELEKLFRDDVRMLEALMRQKVPVEAGQDDRRALGTLIFEFEQRGLFKKLELSEAKLVNTIRNALNHPDNGDVSDDLLKRGLESVRALIRILRGNVGKAKCKRSS